MKQRQNLRRWRFRGEGDRADPFPYSSGTGTRRTVALLTAEEVIDRAGGVLEVRSRSEYLLDSDGSRGGLLWDVCAVGPLLLLSCARQRCCAADMEQRSDIDSGADPRSVRVCSSMVDDGHYGYDDGSGGGGTRKVGGGEHTSTTTKETWKETIRPTELNDLVTPDSTDLPPANLVLDRTRGRNTDICGWLRWYHRWD